MFTRIVAVAAVVLALMAVVKDGRVLRTTGLTGSCIGLQRTTDGSRFEACRAGRFSGPPNLGSDGCQPAGNAGPLVYWKCPSPGFARAAGR
jgi:hypothetical protein